MTPAQERELRALVGRIASVLNAERLIVWDSRPEGLNYAFGYFAPESAVFQGLEVWQHCQDELRHGRTIEEEGYTYRPVLSSDCTLVGVVQSAPFVSTAGAAAKFDAHDAHYLEQRLRTLAVLMRQPAEPSQPGEDVVMYTAAALEQTAGRQRVRTRELLAALRRRSWNISAVARAFQVTPQTVRNWMRATGLKRSEPSPFDPRAARSASR